MASEKPALQVMDKATAQKLFIEGKLCGFVGEYRGSKGETVKFLDKKTGRAASFPSLKHTIEVNGEAVSFSERVADDFDVNNFTVPHKKGDIVVCRLTSYQVDKGLLRGSGSLELLKA